MNYGARILVVDDERQIRRSLQVSLESKGYAVVLAESGEQALTMFGVHPADVVLMDLLLPGMDGVEATRRLREHSSVPIIVLSAVSTEAKKVTALELGADDYVTKPFSTAEVLARINSALRRAAGAKSIEPLHKCGELSVNFATREVQLAGDPVKLTPTEYDLLKYMLENSGRVLTHQMLLRAVWGESSAEQAHYLRVFIRQLRKKIERDPTRPRYIVTDTGVGYRFASGTDE